MKRNSGEYVERLMLVLAFVGMSSVSFAQTGNEINGADSADAQEATVGNTISPERPMRLDESQAPVPMSESKRQQLMDALRQNHLPTPNVPNSHAPLAPAGKGRQTGPRSGGLESLDVAPQAPGTVTIWRNSTITPPAGFSSDINEPSLAANGKYGFITGNWYAARTFTAGASWINVNPFTDMGGAAGDFCCDQDVIYDKSRNMMLWYRQGLKNRQANGTNRIRLGRSLDGGATWVFYDIRPTSINATWTNQWFDYPHIALSNGNFYFASNMFSNADVYQRSVLVRISLDQLRAGAAISVPSWNQTAGTWVPVQGATETMYLGRHETTSTFRIYSLPESSSVLSSVLKAIPAWESSPRGSMVCTLSSGENPCARSDSRPLSGWISYHKQELGFFWNVKQNTALGFPFPYVNSAVFSLGTLNHKYRPFIWNPGFAWMYAAASPNARGDVGIASFAMGGSTLPQAYIGIDDDFNGQPPGWDVTLVASSTSGPGSNSWGDYLRVRPYSPADLGWAASAYVSVGGTSQPRYVIWSRERDLGGVGLWFLQP